MLYEGGISVSPLVFTSGASGPPASDRKPSSRLHKSAREAHRQVRGGQTDRQLRFDHLWTLWILNSACFQFQVPSHPICQWPGETGRENNIKTGFTADRFLCKKTYSGPSPPDRQFYTISVIDNYFRDEMCLYTESHQQMWDKQKCRYFRWRLLLEQMKVREENNA